MNKVFSNEEKKVPLTDAIGSIWASDEGDLYILCNIGSNLYPFVAVSLADGNRWGDPNASIEGAVDGLTLKFSAAKISVEQL